jgi:hypothetical protein
MLAAGSGYELRYRIIRERRGPVAIKGSRHCGNTKFEVSEQPSSVNRCTCSLCAKRGALWAYYTPAQFRLTSPAENIATYLWQPHRETSFLRQLLLQHVFGVAGRRGRLRPFDSHYRHRVALAIRNFHSACQQPRHRPDLHRRIDRAELCAGRGALSRGPLYP